MASVLRYGSARMFASVQDSPGTLRSLTLVNNVDFGFAVRRKNIKSIGYSNIATKILSAPVPEVSFSYYLSDLDNERLFNLPVTSHEALNERSALFSQIEAVDLAFAIDENSKDFASLSNSEKQEISICVITNCYLTSYSFEVNSMGIINASVSFSGDDILFKTFKNLSEYSVLQEDSEDNLMTNENEFIINDGSEELTDNIGGGTIASKVNGFSFDASIPYKTLIDFGQIFHKKKVDYPFETQISVSAIVDSFFEGKLSNVFCQDKKNDFILSNKRVECGGKKNEKSGMLFKGAQLISQRYSQETSGFLNAELKFSLQTNRDCGIYFTQHVQTGEVLVGEDTSILDHILLEDTTSSSPKILLESIADMISSLKEFRLNGACSVAH